jgi:hypothetical protein
MAEDRPTSVASTATAAHCPWCSADINPGAAMCSTCGAALVEPDGSVPGVNAVDPRSVSKIARTTAPAQRSRLLSWLTGDYVDDDQAPAPPGSLAPPPPEVRREILRLEIEAEYASLQAEVQALAAEAEADARATTRVASPEGDGAAATQGHSDANADGAQVATVGAAEAQTDGPSS